MPSSIQTFVPTLNMSSMFGGVISTSIFVSHTLSSSSIIFSKLTISLGRFLFSFPVSSILFNTLIRFTIFSFAILYSSLFSDILVITREYNKLNDVFPFNNNSSLTSLTEGIKYTSPKMPFAMLACPKN